MPDQASAIEISSSTGTQKAPNLSHRLPTQSAAAALEDLHSNGSLPVSTGLASLDSALSGSRSLNGGFERGKVAELWGPAGAGKTALAFQAATQAVNKGDGVLWIHASTLLGTSRLRTAIHDSPEDAQGSSSGQLSSGSFSYLSASTLSHLLALILHPPPSLFTKKAALLVIDDVNKLIDLDYPRLPFNSGNRTDQQKWQAGRRYAVLGSLSMGLNKLAALHDVAVIVTTSCSSRMRSDSGLTAAIGPGVGGSEWEGGIWSRIVVFHDFQSRFLGVQKVLGRNLTPLDPVGDIRNVIKFEMGSEGGLKERIIDLTSSDPGTIPTLPKKPSSSPVKLVRKRTYDEVADSDDDADEYGWAEADNVVIVDGPNSKGKLPDEALKRKS